MQILNRLEDHLHLTVPIKIFRIHHPTNLRRNFFRCKLIIKLLHRIDAFTSRLFQLRLTVRFNFVEYALIPRLPRQ